MATLFYDGRCPICAHEISLLRKLKNEALDLIDIHTIKDESAFSDLDQSQDIKTQLLTILHLRADNGTWLKGLDATVAAWRHTAIGFLLLPLRWPLIKPIADTLYYRWANKRVCNVDYGNRSNTKNQDQ
ncbi:MAG: DUF393 domain-containing protein [Pseudomonadota bacterium]